MGVGVCATCPTHPYITFKWRNSPLRSFLLSLPPLLSDIPGSTVLKSARRPISSSALQTKYRTHNTRYGVLCRHHQLQNRLCAAQSCRNSSVGIATRYGLDGPGIESSRSQWPSGLRRESAADRLLGLQVRIPPGAWMFVLYVIFQEGRKAKPGRSTNKVQRTK